MRQLLRRRFVGALAYVAFLARRGVFALERATICQLGFTVIEMAYAMAIIGTLVAIALPRAQQYYDRARNAKAIGDIEAIQSDLAGHEMLDGRLPGTLAEIGRGDLMDPWGNPYQYLKFPEDGSTPEGARKDRFLVPINTSYDLYSMGKDGLTDVPLTSSPAKDDIVRANDGGFIGLAIKY